MLMRTACDALASGHRLELRYDGFTRVVEVHTCGETTAGNDAMRVFQVRGGSVSHERTGWKLLRLDEASSGTVLDESSAAPRPGYKRGDPAFAQIVKQV